MMVLKRYMKSTVLLKNNKLKDCLVHIKPTTFIGSRVFIVQTWIFWYYKNVFFMCNELNKYKQMIKEGW